MSHLSRIPITAAIACGIAMTLTSGAARAQNGATSPGPNPTRDLRPGTVAAEPGTNAAGAPEKPGNTASMHGLVLKNGILYLVRGGTAARIDSSTVPAGQMLTKNGGLTTAPQPHTTVAGSTTSTSAVDTSGNLSSVNATIDGVIFDKGVPYIIRTGYHPTKVDETLLPPGQMLPVTGGPAVPAPAGIPGLDEAQPQPLIPQPTGDRSKEAPQAPGPNHLPPRTTSPAPAAAPAQAPAGTTTPPPAAPAAGAGSPPR